MKNLNKIGIACVLACAGAGLALAEPISAVEVHSVTVKYSASAAQTPSGAKSLHNKLRSAARHVCGDGASARGHALWATRECAASAVTSAVVAVNIPALDAVHGYQRGTVEVIASR